MTVPLTPDTLAAANVPAAPQKWWRAFYRWWVLSWFAAAEWKSIRVKPRRRAG
jgi:hypothetical protein